MAHKDRDILSEERPSERRHRTKSEKEASRAHKSSRNSKPKIIDSETGEPIRSPHRRHRDKDREKGQESDPSTSMADLVPELARIASAPGAISRSSLPYPSFSKAHSKEAVNSRENFGMPVKKTNPYTPESTDLGSDEKQRSKSVDNTTPLATNVTKDGRPPSPPDTEFSQFSQQRKATRTRMTKLQEDEETESRPSSRNSFFGRIKRDKDDKSKVSVKSKGSKASTALKSPRKPEHATVKEKQITGDGDRDENTGSRVTSNATSVAPPRKIHPEGAQKPVALDTYSSPDSAQDSSPRTPTQAPQFPPPTAAEIKPPPSPFIHFEIPETDSSAYDSPQPPPPPPPPVVPINIPRVDYLMQNGGLPRLAPKTLLSGVPVSLTGTPSAATPMPSEVERIFGPFYNILDQYETVINKNGSLAVATGYRSVARRLLDRLENVFNRDLSSEGCFCVMCQNVDPAVHEGSRGLGWGEVLEWVSNRRELPLWPAFDFATLGVKAADEIAGLGLGISGHHRTASDPVRAGSPVKIDPDIAEEYRDHFLQQSKKTKMAVNRWLSSCPQTAATPPQEVDDETLSFAILTHLDPSHRPLFNALISGSTVLQPVTRAATPLRKPRSDFMVKTVQSLQRLYRLPLPPRDPEAAVYLLKNPHIHNLLATLSSISVSEWEILTSGRFDGFLWSGAESDIPSANPSPAPSRGPTPSNAPLRSPMSPGVARQASGSRTTTPFSPMRGQTFSPILGSNGFPTSRGPTPSSQLRHPVSNDEETEIAVLAEVEREIYQGMEILEDAFEGLHRKAEMVRRALRERGAGLSISLQSRRTSHPDIITASTPGLPSAGLGPGYERPNWAEGGSELNSESDWDPGEEMLSELAPDDSASNISSSRHRRPKRRYERRTPALVEEEDED